MSHSPLSHYSILLLLYSAILQALWKTLTFVSDADTSLNFHSMIFVLTFELGCIILVRKVALFFVSFVVVNSQKSPEVISEAMWWSPSWEDETTYSSNNGKRTSLEMRLLKSNDQSSNGNGNLPGFPFLQGGSPPSCDDVVVSSEWAAVRTAVVSPSNSAEAESLVCDSLVGGKQKEQIEAWIFPLAPFPMQH